VRFAPGSAIATIAPEPPPATGDEPLALDEMPLAVENLLAVVDQIDAGAGVSEPVIDALGKACRALGSDGSIAVEFPPEIRTAPGRIDLPSLERLGHLEQAGREQVHSVSGRLHLLDVEPDRLAIRASSGVDWTCKYPEQLEGTVTRLIGQIVWAQGAGQLTSPLRGTMTLERIEPVEQGEQATLFTAEPTPDSDLLARQGITGPQGLASLADPEWDEDADGAYLKALTGR
jgi:hypothetical protein